MRQARRRSPPRPRRGAAPERRPQQRSVETRDKLVEAALEVFASRGFEGATTREIARRAGVALAALPYHFTTKETLWQAAADRVFGRLTASFATRLAGLEGVDAPTRLRLLLRDFVRFQARNPAFHRFMLSEGMQRTPRLEWLVAKHVRPLHDAVRALVKEAQAAGLVRAGRPELLHYMLIGAASTPYSLGAEYELLTGVRPDSEKRVEEHAELLLRLFFPEPPPR